VINWRWSGRGILGIIDTKLKDVWGTLKMCTIHQLLLLSMATRALKRSNISPVDKTMKVSDRIRECRGGECARVGSRSAADTVLFCLVLLVADYIFSK
jgi:hypothetical protein